MRKLTKLELEKRIISAKNSHLSFDLSSLRQVEYGKKARKHWVVNGSCSICGCEKPYNVDNIVRGLSTKCKCLRRRLYFSDEEVLLGKRYDAMKQRCRNTGTDMQKNYGARGIKNRFRNRRHFIDYIKNHLPHKDYIDVEIDRIDTNGHYEEGNLRLVTKKENLKNKRKKRVYYDGMFLCVYNIGDEIRKYVDSYFGYSNSWTRTLHYKGMSIEKILRVYELKRTVCGKKYRMALKVLNKEMPNEPQKTLFI